MRTVEMLWQLLIILVQFLLSLFTGGGGDEGVLTDTVEF